MTFSISWLTNHDDFYDPVTHAAQSHVVVGGTLVERVESGIIVPYFTVTARNPGIQGIIQQQERYAILTEQRPGDAEPIILARGRINAMPSELADDRVQIEFVCVPPDEDDVLKAAADALRVGEIDYDPDASLTDRDAAETYDPLFYDRSASDDPANALLGTLDYWRWDPVTLQIGRVSMIEGETEHVITSGRFESESLRYLNPPRRRSRMRIIAGWTQMASGKQTSPIGVGLQSVTTYSYQSIIDGFPKNGDPIGNANGWTMAEAYIIDVQDHPLAQTYDIPSDEPGVLASKIRMRPKRVEFRLWPAFDYQQAREEILDLTMLSGTQDVLGDDRTEVIETINLAPLDIDASTPDWMYEDPETLDPMQYQVGDYVIANGKRWRCDVAHTAAPNFFYLGFASPEDTERVRLWTRVSSNAAIDSESAKFFDTDRGKRAVRHGLRRLRRAVVERSLAAELSFEIDWSVGRSITCADSCRVEHPRLPGGEVVGKVSSVEKRIAENSGMRSVVVTIMLPVGAGDALSSPDPEQQTADGVVYDFTAPAPNEPVNIFQLRNQEPFYYIDNDFVAQELVGRVAENAGQDPVAAIGGAPTRITLVCDPIREEDLLVRRMSAVTEPLSIPRGIDLKPVL